MAKSSNSTAPVTEIDVEPQGELEASISIDVGPDQSPGLIAAWDGIYHFFGGRVESFEVASDGVIARGFSVNSEYSPQTILRDVNRKNRRVPLFPAIQWLQGMEPETFKTPQEITTYMVQFFKGSVEEGSSRSPKYLRDAVNAYRTRTGTGGKRGPKPQILKKLASLDANLLKEAPASDLEHLQDILNQVRASQAATLAEANA